MTQQVFDIKLIEANPGDIGANSQQCLLIPPTGSSFPTLQFNAMISNQLSRAYTIPTKKVDQEYADHRFPENRQFDLTVKVKKTEDLGTLQSFADASLLYAFACDFGYFENVTLKNFTAKIGDTQNTAGVTFQLVQLIVGTTQKTTTSLPVSDTNSPGSRTATSVVSNTTTNSQIDNIKSWFGWKD